MLARPEKQLRQPQRASVPARPEFAWERIALISRELPALFRLHWREIALNQDRIELDPDWDRYLALEAMGILHVLTVRSGGALIGYVFAFVAPHLHYVSTPWAVVDMFWLNSVYRFGWTGVRMLREMERGLAERGAQIVHISEKLHFKDGRVGRVLFRRLGYTMIETVWAKRLAG